MLLTSCSKKEAWFSCIEGYTKNRGDQTADFYIKILRTNGSIEANYIDAYNSVRASTTETPSTFTVSATLYPTAFKKRLVQSFFLINKKNLKYSKQMSHFDPTKWISLSSLLEASRAKTQESAERQADLNLLNQIHLALCFN